MKGLGIEMGFRAAFPRWLAIDRGGDPRICKFGSKRIGFDMVFIKVLARSPNPGIQAQDSKPRTPNPGIQAQESKPRTPNPGIQTQESRPRNPNQGIQTQELRANMVNLKMKF